MHKTITVSPVLELRTKTKSSVGGKQILEKVSGKFYLLSVHFMPVWGGGGYTYPAI